MGTTGCVNTEHIQSFRSEDFFLLSRLRGAVGDDHGSDDSWRTSFKTPRSCTKRSFASRASQPTPICRRRSGRVVPRWSWRSVASPCSARYCQIRPAAAPISLSIASFLLSAGVVLPSWGHSFPSWTLLLCSGELLACLHVR